MNPLGNISDIDHVLSESKLDDHLQKNLVSGQKDNTESHDKLNTNPITFTVKDESIMKVRTDRAY